MKRYYGPIRLVWFGLAIMFLVIVILMHVCSMNNKEWLWIIVPLVAIAMFGVFGSGVLLGLGESRNLENYLSDGDLVLIRGRHVERFSKHDGIHLLVELKPGELCYLFYGKGQREEDYDDDNFVIGYYYRYIGKNLLPLPIGKNV